MAEVWKEPFFGIPGIYAPIVSTWDLLADARPDCPAKISISVSSHEGATAELVRSHIELRCGDRILSLPPRSIALADTDGTRVEGSIEIPPLEDCSSAEMRALPEAAGLPFLPARWKISVLLSTEVFYRSFSFAGRYEHVPFETWNARVIDP